MILPLTPFNASAASACEALDAYNAGRPPSSEAFVAVNYALFAYSMLFWAAALVFFERHRAKPRIATYLLVSINVILQSGLLLNQAVFPNMPCGYFLFALLAGLGCSAVHFYFVMVVYIVEAYFAKKAAVNLRVFKPKTVTSPVAPIQEESRDEDSVLGVMLVSRAESLKFFAQFALGLKSVGSLPDHAFARLRAEFTTLAFIAFIPMVVVFIVIFAYSPVYRECSGCPLFLEPFLGFLAAYTIYVIAVTRVIFAINKAKLLESDNKVFTRLGVVLRFGTPSALAAGVLTLVDPGEAAYNKIFLYFEWLFFAIMHIPYAWGMVGVPVLEAWHRYSRIVAEDVSVDGDDIKDDIPGSTNPTRAFSSFQRLTPVSPPRRATDEEAAKKVRPLPPFIATIESDERIKTDFEAYVKKQFAIENMYFLDDIRIFKELYERKSDVWRRDKIQALMDAYIETNSRMEINISSKTRERLIKKVSETLHPSSPSRGLDQMVSVFDEAVSDISHEVLNGLWIDYQQWKRSKRQLSSTAALKVSLTSSSNA